MYPRSRKKRSFDEVSARLGFPQTNGDAIVAPFGGGGHWERRHSGVPVSFHIKEYRAEESRRFMTTKNDDQDILLDLVVRS